MTPDNIETMVTRLAGMWPSQFIAMNVVCAAWTKSDVLLRLSVAGGREIVDKVKSEKQFPSLGHVEALARRQLQEETPPCTLCKNDGWIYPEDQRQYTVDGGWIRRSDIVDAPLLDKDGNQIGTYKHVGRPHVVRCPQCFPDA